MKRPVCDCIHFDGSNCVAQAAVEINGKRYCVLCADLVCCGQDEEDDLKMDEKMLQEKLQEERNE